MANSLFGASAAEQITTVPKIPQHVEEWNLMERLKREKEVTGIYLSGHPLDDFKLELKKLTKPISRLDEFKQQEVAIGGIISQINHRVSKKGTQFGFATIEDSTGHTIEFGAFGDLYLRSRHLLEKDTIVYVKGKYQPSYRDETKYEFRVQDILLLEDVGTQPIKGVCIHLPIEMLNEQLIKNLRDICNEFIGEQQLDIKLLDVQNKLVLPLSSSNTTINADSLFIKEIEKLSLRYDMIT